MLIISKNCAVRRDIFVSSNVGMDYSLENAQLFFPHVEVQGFGVETWGKVTKTQTHKVG